MNVKISMDGEIEVYAEECDICKKCHYAVDCPLIAALHNEVVILRYESIEVEQCGLFKPKGLPKIFLW